MEVSLTNSLPFAFRHIGKTLVPMLQPNFAKEPFSPSHANRLTERQCSKNERKISREMNNETLTKCICHKGLSWYSSVVARSKFFVDGQETTPQSLEAHTLNRWQQV